MLDHNEDCRYCGTFMEQETIKVQRNGLDGYAVECGACGARGPWGRDILEAVSGFENPFSEGEDEC